MSAYPSWPPEKLLQATDNVFRATLPRLAAAQKAPGDDETDEEKILSFLKTEDAISRTDAEKLTGLSTASVARLIRRMVNEGRLKAVGSGRNTRYCLPKS